MVVTRLLPLQYFPDKKRVNTIKDGRNFMFFFAMGLVEWATILLSNQYTKTRRDYGQRDQKHLSRKQMTKYI